MVEDKGEIGNLMFERTNANNWYFSLGHGQLCQDIETRILWGDTTCSVWLPVSASVVRIPAANLKPLEDAATVTPAGITYVVVASGVADAFTQDVLLVPIESSARGRSDLLMNRGNHNNWRNKL